MVIVKKGVCMGVDEEEGLVSVTMYQNEFPYASV